jgi:hypothetical protein
MTREEAQQACAELAESSPDRATHRFMPRQGPDGEWSVAKVNLAPTKLTGSSLAAQPRPDPEDPRDGKPSPFWHV